MRVATYGHLIVLAAPQRPERHSPGLFRRPLLLHILQPPASQGSRWWSLAFEALKACLHLLHALLLDLDLLLREFAIPLLRCLHPLVDWSWLRYTNL